jgi:hypothetical protein
LSMIPRSPWKVTGAIIGGTPTKFFTMGQDNLHSYGIASDRAIQSQLSQIRRGTSPPPTLRQKCNGRRMTTLPRCSHLPATSWWSMVLV